MTKYQLPDLTYVWAEGGSAVKPPNEKIQKGWIVEKPLANWQNWVNQKTDISIKYLVQQGIPEWSDKLNYFQPTSHVVGSNGSIFQCIKDCGVDTILVDPVESNVSSEYWKPFAKDINETLDNLAGASGAGLVGHSFANKYGVATVGYTLNTLNTSLNSVTTDITSIKSSQNTLSDKVEATNKNLEEVTKTANSSVKSVNGSRPNDKGDVTITVKDLKVINDTEKSTETTYSSDKITKLIDGKTVIDDKNISTSSTFSSQEIVNRIPKIILSPIEPSVDEMKDDEIWLIYDDTIAPDVPTIVYYNWDGMKIIAEPKSKVTMYGFKNSVWTVLHSIDIDETGTFETDTNYFSIAKTESYTAFKFTNTDLSGNESEPLNINVVNPNNDVPVKKYNNKTRLEGTGALGSKVYVSYNNNITETVVNDRGVWVFEPNPFINAPDDYVGSVTGVNVFGYESATASVGKVDKSTPTAPYISVNSKDVISGTGEAGGTITIYDNNDEIVSSMTIRSDSTWSFIPNPLTNGGYAIITDIEGNESDRTIISSL